MSEKPHRAWYRSQRWRKLAKAHLIWEPLCRMCAYGDVVTSATVCDHVEPHRGNERKFWAGPFQSLCAGCHSGSKQRQEHGREVAVIDEAGWPSNRD